MTRKLLVVFLIMAVFICTLPFTAIAEVEPPSAIGAPEHFGVSPYYGDAVYFTFSVPEDMRAYIVKRAADDPDNKQNFSAHFQIDYKIDNGSWHSTPAWDSPKTVPDLVDDQYFTFSNERKYSNSERWSMTGLFPEDEALKPFAEGGWDYLKSHSITFRVRFSESFDNGETYVLSPWSKEFTLSANAKADYNKLINHIPTLVSADVKTAGGGEPYFDVKLGRLPDEVQDLNAMTGGSVRAEVWMRRAGDKDFKYIHYEWASLEILEIEASDYFNDEKQSYDAEGYEIKIRYALDLREYKQAGIDSTTNVDIYSPFSNVISHNMPSWSDASTWATPELKKADEAGLIPDILKGENMTKPITREEFAELAVKLYEKTTGKTAEVVSPNPFTDTKNSEILKAFKLGVTTGTSATTFAPKELTNREQVATMLSRAIRVMAPGGDFSTAGAPTFSDQKDISSWALEHVKFMSKAGIVKGTNGKFMPKAATSAQAAAGYATTTREQAIAMSVRSYEQFKSSSTAPAPTPGMSTGTAGIAGVWDTHMATGTPQDIHLTYVFNSDGTYNYLIRSTYDYSCNAYKGNYQIDNGKILFTGVSKILFYYDKPDYRSLMAEAEKAGYQPTDNHERTFVIINSDKIEINDLSYKPVQN
ncbi:MAG: hypothetical protein K0R80_752 [Clostridia bacterium]|jgi:hypothetical protein|nr:hypothetical protein [Clostridia bacterium]